MFYNNCIKCDICGFIMNSFGCCLYGDEEYGAEDLCSNCEKAVKDAKEQSEYLRILNKKIGDIV